MDGSTKSWSCRRSRITHTKGIFFGGIIADVVNAAKDKKRDADDSDLATAIKSAAKSIADAREKAVKANATKEQLERYDQSLEMLKPYLPAEISREVTEQSVMTAISVGAKNIGDVMRYIKANNLPADMKTANEIARGILGGK